MRIRSPELFVLTVCVATGASGCFAVRQVDIKAGLDEVRAEGAVPAEQTTPAQPRPAPIQVSVVTTPSYGGYCAESAKGEDKARGFLVCRGGPVKPGTEAEQIETMASGRSNVGLGYDFSGFGTVVQQTLTEHLQERFADVRVELVDRAPAGGITVNATLDLYTHFMRTGDKTAFVTLEALGAGPAPITVTMDAARAIGHAHLIWMIPFGFATFPIGFAIGLAIFNGVEDSKVEESVAAAIDRATAVLAAKLAQDSNGGGTPPATMPTGEMPPPPAGDALARRLDGGQVE